EGYLALNPAEGITAMSTKSNGEDRRLPYSTEDLKAIFAVKRIGTNGLTGANYWLPWLALYTGARLEELGQLRITDVRKEDGVRYLAIGARRRQTREDQEQQARRADPSHTDQAGLA